MKKIEVSLKGRSYDILIGRGLLERCGALLKGLRIGRDAVVITNRRLSLLYGKAVRQSLKRAGLSVRFELVPDSEKAKSTKIATAVINRISAYDKSKSVFIAAFGGGVVGDLAGFVAAVYKRGIPYVQIPTTLLAQVDSAIGGKVAIDLPVAKNLVGAFYQPKSVISDVSLIKSLPARELKNGLAEVIKYGVISDSELFEYLERNYKRILRGEARALKLAITRSAAIKGGIVQKDELDTRGLRMILNYGHTIGHAIERASGYSKRYSHGEAIAIGMVAAARISCRLGKFPRADSDRIEALIKRIGLPTRIVGLKLRDIYEAHLHDKKFTGGQTRFVLPTRIGNSRVVKNVAPSVIKTVLEGLVKK